MKGNLQDIVKQLNDDTPIEEFLTYCDNVNEIHIILDEYDKFKNNTDKSNANGNENH